MTELSKSKKKIIGVTGIAGAGKDTFAYTIKNSEINTEVFAFAGPLKEASKILFNFSHDQLYHPVIKEEVDPRWNKSPRQILQWLGTDILRTHVNPDFFIMNMKQRIEDSKAEYIIISDCRFDNEAEFVRSLGGKIVKILRDNDKNKGMTTKHSDHVTERGISLDLVDAIIENNSSIEEFQNNAIIATKFLFKKNDNNDYPNHSNHFTVESDFSSDNIDEIYPNRFKWNQDGSNN